MIGNVGKQKWVAYEHSGEPGSSASSSKLVPFIGSFGLATLLNSSFNCAKASAVADLGMNRHSGLVLTLPATGKPCIISTC